jgi:hypothetical protein
LEGKLSHFDLELKVRERFMEGSLCESSKADNIFRDLLLFVLRVSNLVLKRALSLFETSKV